MDYSKVGNLIYTLRTEKGMTQKALANIMDISDRAVSKWECGVGCPDVSLLRELPDILGANIEKILLGDLESNRKDGGNMKRIRFYVCPVCGNATSSTGMAEISCYGRKLNVLKARPVDLSHSVSAEAVEGDYYITLEHDMEKQHYITFMAYAVYDRVFLMKLYSEQAVQVRFPRPGHGMLYICCNSHGLFSVSLQIHQTPPCCRQLIEATQLSLKFVWAAGNGVDKQDAFQHKAFSRTSNSTFLPEQLFLPNSIDIALHITYDILQTDGRSIRQEGKP